MQPMNNSFKDRVFTEIRQDENIKNKLKLGLASIEIQKYLKPQGLIEIQLFKSRKITARHILAFLEIFQNKAELDKNNFLVIIQFLSSFYLSLPEKSQLAHHLEAALAKLLSYELSTNGDSKQSSATRLLDTIEVYFEKDQDKKIAYLGQQQKLIKKMQEINKLDEIKDQFFFASKKTEINQIRLNKFTDVYLILNLSASDLATEAKNTMKFGKIGKS